MTFGTTRRGLLGAAVAAPLAVVPAGAQASGPDTTVIALCAELNRLERQRIALFYGPARIEDDDDRNELQDPIDEAQEPLLDRLCAAKCRTPAGIVAKLCTLALMAGDLTECHPDDGYDDSRLLGSVLRDALRAGGADLTAWSELVDARWPASAA